MGEKLRQSDIAEQDLFGQVVKSAKELTLVLDKTNKEINETVTGLAKIASTASADSQKGINKIVAAQKKMNTEFVKAQKIEKDTIKNSKALQKARLDELRLQKQREQAFDKFEKQQQRNLKLQEREARAIRDSKNEYKQLSRKVNESQAEFKRLAAAHGVNSTQARKAKVTFDALDKKLRGINTAARDGRRDVGRYGLALQGVRGAALRMAAALGIAGGGFMAFRKIGSVIVDFNQAQTDLAAISQRSTEELAQFEKQARELGATTQFTATEITGLQLELAKLGFTTDEILNSTGGISNFAAATGVEIPRAAKVAGSALRAFGLDATEIDRVVSTLGVATTKSALDFGFLETALSTVAPVANAMGFSIEDTTALLSQLADSGFDASTSATATRNILLNLADANGDLAKELGRPITSAGDLAGALQELDAKGIDLATTLELTDKRSVAAFNTFLNGADKLSETKDSITDVNDELEKMAADRLDSVEGQWKLLTSALEAYILGAADSTQATEKLKNILGFLKDNLTTILSVLGNVIKSYVLYKATLAALRLKDHVSEIMKQRKALKAAGEEQTKMSKGAGKLKASLKAIGWAAAIALVAKYVAAIVAAVNGTDRLERSLASLNKSVGKAEEQATARSNKRQESLARQIREIKKLGLTEEETRDRVKKVRDDVQRAIEQDVINVEKRKKEAQKDLIVSQALLAEFDGNMVKMAESARNLGGPLSGAQIDLLKMADAVGANEAKVAATNKRIEIYRNELGGLNDVMGDYSLTVDTNTEAVEDHTEAIEEETKAYKDLTDAIIAADEAEKERLALVEDFAIEDVQIRLQTAIDAAKKEATERGVVNVDLINSLIEEEERLLRAKINRIYKTELAEAKSEEERELAATKRTQALIRLDEEFGGRQRKILDDLNNDQETYDEKRLKGTVKTNDDIKDSYDKLFKRLEELGEKALARETKISQAKQKLLDDEIGKSQQLEDRLREGAANGNAIASESLAEQSSITEQKTREKLAEAKREERIEELKALWAALNNFLAQGDSLPKAGGKATAGVFSLKQIFSNLTGFATGTKGRLKDEHKAQFGGVDGHVVRVDDEEAILTGGKMDRLAAAGLHTTDDIVNSAIMNQQLMGVPMANGIDDRTVASSMAIEKKLDALIDVAKENKPVRMHPVFKGGMLDAIVEQQGNKRNWNYRK